MDRTSNTIPKVNDGQIPISELSALQPTTAAFAWILHFVFADQRYSTVLSTRTKNTDKVNV